MGPRGSIQQSHVHVQSCQESLCKSLSDDYFSDTKHSCDRGHRCLRDLPDRLMTLPLSSWIELAPGCTWGPLMTAADKPGQGDKLSSQAGRSTLSELFHVPGRYRLGISQLHRKALRHAATTVNRCPCSRLDRLPDLRRQKEWIWGYDTSCGKVDALAHHMTAKQPFFALEELANACWQVLCHAATTVGC